MCKVLDVLSFFALSQFNFPNENAAKLYEELSEADRKVFNFDTNTIKWEPFLNDYIAGVRRFLLRESDDEIASARDRYKRYCALGFYTLNQLMDYVYMLISIFFRLFMIHCAAQFLGVSFAAAGILVPLTFIFP